METVAIAEWDHKLKVMEDMHRSRKRVEL